MNKLFTTIISTLLMSLMTLTSFGCWLYVSPEEMANDPDYILIDATLISTDLDDRLFGETKNKPLPTKSNVESDLTEHPNWWEIKLKMITSVIHYVFTELTYFFSSVFVLPYSNPHVITYDPSREATLESRYFIYGMKFKINKVITNKELLPQQDQNELDIKVRYYKPDAEIRISTDFNYDIEIGERAVFVFMKSEDGSLSLTSYYIYKLYMDKKGNLTNEKPN